VTISGTRGPATNSAESSSGPPTNTLSTETASRAYPARRLPASSNSTRQLARIAGPTGG